MISIQLLSGMLEAAANMIDVVTNMIVNASLEEISAKRRLEVDQALVSLGVSTKALLGVIEDEGVR